ncbi:LysR family transcriptional regulator [Shewanella psychropiezotolerans]|uniref:LysR family transcriptional regulator n=1 Tax=Shewanella psychropiezotolerans TaxID=2593655 RepID=A0ABX5X390_9GAMM|nr:MULTISPECIES: LysR family transcriptional regulator [Shewanella]MPY26128.1 LysR family transcriptional regulator [Shewanella sp. YLB-07]QDO85819.1 LysR family transcriptional regulator [Shewanella psychropiezotolerans]
MNKSEINLADIKAFTVIAGQGSFTKAAEVLNCSRSHLSKQLTHLESCLGVTLITRTTRAQRLTEQGEAFFNRCRSALESIDQAVEIAVDNAQNLQGSIKINCVGGFLGEEIVASLVNDFIAKYPGVSVELDFSSQRVDLLVDQFDLVFRMGQLEDSGLVARKLMDITNLTLASPKYLRSRGFPIDPKSLKSHQCITGSVSNWSFYHVDNCEHKLDVHINGVFRCKNGRAMKHSALAGNGVVRLPELYCSEELSQGELVSVFEDWRVADTPFYLLYHKDKFQPARIKKFISFTINNFMKYTRE